MAVVRLPLTKKGDISERLIKNLPLPKDKPVFYWHPTFKGFGVVISAKKGTRSYICQRDVNGRTRRVTLGVVGGIAPNEVLTEANRLLQTMRAGDDPRRKSPKASAVGRVMRRRRERSRSARRAVRCWRCVCFSSGP